MRLSLLVLALPLAACATATPPKPAVVEAACAAPATPGLVDARAPGLLGCANALNLRMMVADPADLEQGVGASRAADEAAIAAVQHQRQGVTPRVQPGAGATTAQPDSGS